MVTARNKEVADAAEAIGDQEDDDDHLSAALGKGAGGGRGKALGGHVYEVRMSEEAFQAGMRAIFVQSLKLGRVQTLRKAAVLGLKTILSFDRQTILELLQSCSPGWHKGKMQFYFQLSDDEKALLRDVRKAIGWVEEDRLPETIAETIAIALLAGGNGEAVGAVIDSMRGPKKTMSRKAP